MITTDRRNAGRRQVQRYSVGGGTSASKSDADSRAVDFKLLRNCRVDLRIGGVVRRGGSTVENAPGILAKTLGISEFLAPSADTLIPVTSTLLANFGGANFRKRVAGTWSDVTIGGTVLGDLPNTRPSTFAQLGDKLFIAAGKPALWRGGTEEIRQVGITPLPTTPVLDDITSGSGITLDQGTSYIVTLYDSVTGLESDWSEPSANTGPLVNKSVELSWSAAPAANWDQYRIYRYFDGGTLPYLVTTVSSGTLTYTDSATDASLTTPAAPRYQRALPPSSSFVTAIYSNCVFFVDADDPYKLHFSRPYTDDLNEAEYFPTTQFVRTRHPITALLVTASQMLVFHPRGISAVTQTWPNFQIRDLVPGLGTMFPQSVATNGTDIVFLSEQGLISLSFGNGPRVHLSREIDLQIQPIIQERESGERYASAVWNPAMRQFIFALAAEDGDATRSLIYGWSPELSTPQANLWMEYTFAGIEDGNEDGALVSCLFHPSSSSDANDPQQEKTLFGIYNGDTLGTGGVWSVFRYDTDQDLGADFTAELLTGRLSPGEVTGGQKMFLSLNFTEAYSDPTSDGDGQLKYLLGYADPHLRDYVPQLITISSTAEDRDGKKFPNMLGPYIHLYVSDSSTSQTKVLLSEFFIYFRDRFRREGR